MTELNRATETEEPEVEDALAGVTWPSLPSEQPEAARDPAVSAVLDRLGALPETPVSGHSDIYGGLYDELMEALNEDVAGHISAMGDASDEQA
ncbi:hypothetical protein [Pseudarthrobacter sp. S9]|uniref:hypothetical protein n=1 Tax=Pseudarthrobacter sp. S9 TaxID=3418421 RepID=UPI003D01943C